MKTIQQFTFLMVLLFFAFGCNKDDIMPSRAEDCSTNCEKEPEVGMCNAAFKKYYFDKTEGACKEFIWGGCGGVVPFETLEACEACDCTN